MTTGTDDAGKNVNVMNNSLMNFTGDCEIPFSAARNDQESEHPSDSEDKGLDWILRRYDANTTEAQSLEEELRRLQVLRSYLILDSEKEYPFERLTAFASRILDVPIALVSLGK